MSRYARIALVVVMGLAAATVGQAQSQGPLDAGVAADNPAVGTNMWSNPNLATGAADGNSASANAASGNPTHYLEATGFGFSLPPAAVILGIQVVITKDGLGSAFDNGVFIVKGGVIGSDDHSLGGAWPAGPGGTPVSYGGASDLWGETWTAADINSPNFGVVISAHDSISGALAQVDSFAITVSYGLCGDSIVAPNEQCDDGNTNNGDCCSSTCQFESSGSPCTDHNACTAPDTCDGAGHCDPGAPVVCNDDDPCTQDSCVPASGCAFTAAPRPALSCRAAGKAILLIKSNATPSKDKLVWKWLKGAATTFSDFGDLGTPSGTTAYTLCVYSGTSVALAVTVPDSSTKWTILGANKGYKYKDPTGADDGIQKVLLKAGAAGKAKAQLKGKGVNQPATTLPLTTPVTAQLVNSENPICYTTSFASAKKNSPSQFKAKSP
jgi:cysteine-rich repeat protein